MDSGFREEMRRLFSSKPMEWMVIQTLREAWERIKELEKRVAEL